MSDREFEGSSNGCKGFLGRKEVPIGDLPAAANAKLRLGAADLKRELSKSSPDHLMN